MSYNKMIAVAVTTFFVLLTLFLSMYSVNQGERAVILTNGSFTKVSEPGLHFKIPYIQTSHFISTRVENINYDKVMTYTFDQQTSGLKLSVTYQVAPSDVAKIYNEYGSLDSAIDRIVTPRVYEQVKNTFGQYTAQRAVQERGKLNTDLTVNLQKVMVDTGINIISVQLENIDYTDEYEKAVEAAARAKADIETARSNLAKVEQEAQQKVKQAEAEATAKKLQADADAYATEVAGKATASAILERGKALRDNPDLVSLVAAEKWDGKLPVSMVPGSAIPFVNIK
jgi:regulator of protease activity HflC (stomatin/prohibitin superfamily)